ncbi:hypothetical protein ET445_02975 [Agromyces protaetiae]|uniref:Uncharacterized protein n=1 Tax=Agromyces protaetiae TaxID=2509455 RepID=A0A4P6FPN4_9MICO|nr:hypothetical protein [Agromyces protaetiae]QAY72458.1 hypothetical protein ET445_02975 [Agromyces protaetiae]
MAAATPLHGRIEFPVDRVLVDRRSLVATLVGVAFAVGAAIGAVGFAALVITGFGTWFTAALVGGFTVVWAYGVHLMFERGRYARALGDAGYVLAISDTGLSAAGSGEVAWRDIQYLAVQDVRAANDRRLRTARWRSVGGLAQQTGAGGVVVWVGVRDAESLRRPPMPAVIARKVSRYGSRRAAVRTGDLSVIVDAVRDDREATDRLVGALRDAAELHGVRLLEPGGIWGFTQARLAILEPAEQAALTEALTPEMTEGAKAALARAAVPAPPLGRFQVVGSVQVEYVRGLKRRLSMTRLVVLGAALVLVGALVWLALAVPGLWIWPILVGATGIFASNSITLRIRSLRTIEKGAAVAPSLVVTDTGVSVSASREVPWSEFVYVDTTEDPSRDVRGGARAVFRAIGRANGAGAQLGFAVRDARVLDGVDLGNLWRGRTRPEGAQIGEFALPLLDGLGPERTAAVFDAARRAARAAGVPVVEARGAWAAAGDRIALVAAARRA